MSTRPFVHLHCHSHYSLLDGASSIDGLIEKTKAQGMNALAITDHGNLHGALEFYQKAREAGIKPILGYEAYVAPESRFSREPEDSSYHLTLLAQNVQGFRNLIKLASAAYLEGFYRKPRIDRELLARYQEGLICLSGCVSGEFSRALLRGRRAEADLQQAMDVASWFRDVFGERYYVEIQNNGLPIQQEALEGAVQVARRLGLPLVATSDAHYINREDAAVQDVLLCINTGKYRTDVNRLRMEGDQFYLRSPEEMYAAFPGLEDAVERSQAIADLIDVELDLSQRHFPVFPLPPQTTAAEYLEGLCRQGLLQRYAGNEEMCPGGRLAPAVVERLQRELAVINKLGFANYFLIVWDFVRFARERNIPASARGSGVGSLVSYALGLSHVCPLKYDLLFERFLDENRREAPDIDIDFCQERRGEVLQYVRDKYGAANVAQIGTLGTLGARAAIRDVGRVLGLPLQRVDAIAALVPRELHITLAKALEQSEELRRLYQTDAEVREVLDYAAKVEGLARAVGTHAAGVVIADRPLDEYVPLQRAPGKEEIITQWTMTDVERAGLLKMDFLGLRNLTILSRAVDLIERSTGKRVDPYQFPLDDPETFALLCRGETKGIFQLESGGIRDLLQRMKPDHFRDIIATNALYRPGPLEGGMVDDYIEVKHGRKRAEYKHPVMKEILEETHGVMVYQEQVMRILNRLGKIELSAAYSCIKAISKKKLAVIARFRAEFIAGATAQGLTEREANELFDMIEKFAGYGFNKSHSTAYALIAYMTAYLKAHYPREFMAALLSGDISSRNFKTKDPLVEHLEDCRRMGMELAPPDVNASLPDFSVEGNRIRFGLAAIKGCGWPAAEAIVAQRQRKGPYRDLFDFCERLDPGVVNRTVITALIKAGAFDSCGGRRAQWMAVLDRAMQSGAHALADRRCGQLGLFGEESAEDSTANVSLPDLPEWSERERAAQEKEVLGFYWSCNPLEQHRQRLQMFCTHSTADAAQLPHGSEVLLGGVLGSIKLANVRTPRAGSTATRYAMFDLEDAAGSIRSILWPEDYARCGQLVQTDTVLLARGTIEKRLGSDEATFIVKELLPLDGAEERFARGITIYLDERVHGPEHVQALYEVLRGYPGRFPLQLVLDIADGRRVVCACEGTKIDLHEEMRRRVTELLGAGALRIEVAPPVPAAPGRSNGHSRRTAGALK